VPTCRARLLPRELVAAISANVCASSTTAADWPDSESERRAHLFSMIAAIRAGAHAYLANRCTAAMRPRVRGLGNRHPQTRREPVTAAIALCLPPRVTTTRRSARCARDHVDTASSRIHPFAADVGFLIAPSRAHLQSPILHRMQNLTRLSRLPSTIPAVPNRGAHLIAASGSIARAREPRHPNPLRAREGSPTVRRPAADLSLLVRSRPSP